jgi:hypothetical protein
MSSYVRTEEREDSSPLNENAGVVEIEGGLSETEKQVHASDLETRPQTPQEGAAADGEAATETAKIPSSPLLEGWRLYTVQVA